MLINLEKNAQLLPAPCGVPAELTGALLPRLQASRLHLALPFDTRHPLVIDMAGVMEAIVALDAESYATRADLVRAIDELAVRLVDPDTDPIIGVRGASGSFLPCVPPALWEVFKSWDTSLPIHPGLVGVLGATQAGKSKYIFDILRPEVLLRFGEPYEQYDQGDIYVDHPRNEADLVARTLVYATLGYRVAIDGLRPLVYEISGAATTGGVVARLYSLLTSLSNLVSYTGTTVVASLNPLVADAHMAVVHSMLTASISGTHFLHEGVVSSSLRLQDKRVQFSCELPFGSKSPEMFDSLATHDRRDRGLTRSEAILMDDIDSDVSHLANTANAGADDDDFSEIDRDLTREIINI